MYSPPRPSCWCAEIRSRCTAWSRGHYKTSPSPDKRDGTLRLSDRSPFVLGLVLLQKQPKPAVLQWPKFPEAVRNPPPWEPSPRALEGGETSGCELSRSAPSGFWEGDPCGILPNDKLRLYTWHISACTNVCTYLLPIYYHINYLNTTDLQRLCYGCTICTNAQYATRILPPNSEQVTGPQLVGDADMYNSPPPYGCGILSPLWCGVRGVVS